MANVNTVTRLVTEKLDVLIELENKRSALDDEIEAREGQVARLNDDYRKAMIEINSVYRLIVEMYSLDKKIKYDSGKFPELATYNFGNIELFYTTHRIEDGHTIYILTEDGANFVGLSDEELKRHSAIHCGKKMSKIRAKMMELEIQKSKKEYEVASLSSELQITRPFKAITRLSLKAQLNDARKSLAIIKSQISAYESEMKDLAKNGEKKFFQEAGEMQYLIKSAIELKEDRDSIKDDLEKANEKLNKSKEDFAICLDDQEKVIREIISKPENIAVLQHIIDTAVAGSNYSEISKVVLKLTALESKNKRK